MEALIGPKDDTLPEEGSGPAPTCRHGVHREENETVWVDVDEPLLGVASGLRDVEISGTHASEGRKSNQADGPQIDTVCLVRSVMEFQVCDSPIPAHEQQSFTEDKLRDGTRRPRVDFGGGHLWRMLAMRASTAILMMPSFL